MLMPERRVHELDDLIFLGKKHPEVHKIMDLWSKHLGARHRKFFHDPISLIILFGNDPEKLTSAFIHLIHDELETGMKFYLKRGRSRRGRVDPILRELVKRLSSL